MFETEMGEAVEGHSTASTNHNENVARPPSLATCKTQPTTCNANFGCTLMQCMPGYRATKRYQGDASGAPQDYDAGKHFDPIEVPPSTTFEGLVAGLAALPPNVFMVRGSLVAGVRAEIRAGIVKQIPRRVHDRPDELATFESTPRSWIMLDLDESTTPFDVRDPEGSVRAWHATLPDDLRRARAAFFLSSSSHRSPTVRGKLLVALAAPLDDASAESYAHAIGFDGSVCRTVQPNYLAAPIFDGCADPLVGRRTPIMFDGAPAVLSHEAERATALRPLSGAEPLPTTLAPASADARELAGIIEARWLEGDRIETNAWLHLCGWLLGAQWDKGEISAMLALIDTNEPDHRKRDEHHHVLGNARQLDGPGGARAWLGSDFAAVDVIVNRKRNARMQDHEELPLMITAATGGAMYFIRIGDTNEYRECNERTLRIVLRECGHADRLVGQTGKQLRVEQLRDISITCNCVETDFTRTGNAIYDAANARMMRGVTPKSVAPRFDAGVDAWLCALAGNKIGSLNEWIAGTHQRYVSRCATALVLIGGASVGKTLLATVAAQLWRAVTPVELSAVVSRFNSSMTSSPIVLDDECKCLSRGTVSSEDFRSLIQSRSRPYEPKGLERRMLHGAQRFIITTNSISAIRFSDVAGRDAADAIAERLLLVAVPDAAPARAALDALRRSGGAIDMDRIEGHFAHLQSSVQVPGEEQRFLGTDANREEAMRAALTATIDSAPELFDRIRDVLEGEGQTLSAVPASFARNVIFLHGGELWVRPSTFDDARAVRKAIRPFQVAREKVRIGDATLRATCLDVNQLRVVLKSKPVAPCHSPTWEEVV